MSLTFSSVTRDNLPAACSISLNKRPCSNKHPPPNKRPTLTPKCQTKLLFRFYRPPPLLLSYTGECKENLSLSFFMSFIYSGISTEV